MVLALLGALVIGISLGLLGSGGSILTLPVLVCILHRPEKLAIVESLAIVGCIALIGSIHYILSSQVDWKSVLFFGLPGMLGACAGAHASYYVSGTDQLTIFAFVMLGIAGKMIFASSSSETSSFPRYSIWLLIVEGFIVGCITGFIGIGGGFLIVPALALLSNLPMMLAIGTSLVIIAMNSFTGFIELLFTLDALHMQISWKIIGLISSVGIMGSFAGSFIAKKMSQMRLRQLFGLTVLVMGAYILFQVRS
jgi:uncharacterized membrane protein YfcA